MTRLDKMDMLGLLQEHGAVAGGHFRLASGLHTPVYLQPALVLQYPNLAQKVARALAAKFSAPCDVVISTGMSSVVLGQEVARAKKCRAIFTERVGGAMAFRRDFTLERGQRALVVVDVLTTGRSNAEVVALAQAYGARVIGVGAMVDRSQAPLCLGVPVRSLIAYPLQAAPPDNCPQCQAGVPMSPARRALETGADSE